VSGGDKENSFENVGAGDGATAEDAIETEPCDVEEGADEQGDVLARLEARLEEAQRLQARQSDLVDRLHAENQELRAGELRNTQLPLIRDLLRLHDDIGRIRKAAGEGDTDLRMVQDSLLDTLSRNGVEPFVPGQGESFDSRLHAAAGVVPTEDESLDRAVEEVVRRGFRWDSGEVIRVAEVRAYRYQSSAPDSS
jgi:molecular chaperone GrpE